MQLDGGQRVPRSTGYISKCSFNTNNFVVSGALEKLCAVLSAILIQPLTTPHNSNSISLHASDIL